MICPDCERPVATPTTVALVGGDTCQAGLVPWLPAVIADCQRHTIARLRDRHYCPQCLCRECALERAKESP